jgi:hypothetical protein
MEAGTLDAGVRVWVGERRFVLLERRMRKASETGLPEKRSAGGGGKWRLEEATARRRKVVGGVGGGGGRDSGTLIGNLVYTNETRQNFRKHR